MNILKKYIYTLILGALCITIHAQDQGSFTGGFQTSANLFLRDSLIGAFNIPQYDRELIGSQTWLDLGYTQDGFDVGLRFDIFNNSNLRNPNDSYTNEEVGRWHVAKKVDKFDIRVGYIYDQIGSGIIFRAFEERPLLIDNALVGGRIIYDLSDNWQLKAFTGRQRNRQREISSTYSGTVKGTSLEGFVDLSKEATDDQPRKVFTLAPGIAMVNRTLADETIDQILNEIAGYATDDQVLPKYNTYAFTFFNTTTLGNFNWYLETAFKTEEAFFNPFKSQQNGILGKFVKESGTVFYTSLSFAKSGLGVTLEGKRTENFDFRTNPRLGFTNGVINYIPPMNRQNTYRLNARYSPATQLLSEQAYQIDVKYRWNKKLSTTANYSYITDLDGQKLYSEIFTEVYYKFKNRSTIKGGIQFLNYNQEIYEGKPQVPIVETIVPYVDYLHKLSRKTSVRTELQYMKIGDDEKAEAKQDYGDWIFAQVEFAMAPHWSFVVSDMYNVDPGKASPKDENGEKLSLHYPRLDVYYTHKANRFSFSYIKQVEGIVCTGGICRLEPAFSGFNFSAQSNF
ncbi:MAG: hypothetical protein HKO66_09575 [Saprospiraceae bacterium]|nr:hypothetical protein [Bacteroidia bacterium]NNE14504.1 hypothetical protein [Saprospiraceae bacterium]NNL92468.1 hypothetical protein [Saprospiraceae bacterium]